MSSAFVPAWLILLVIVAGASIAAQQLINSGLRNEIGSAWWAGLISYIGRTAFMLAALLVNRVSPPSMLAFKRVQLVSWTGGLLD